MVSHIFLCNSNCRVIQCFLIKSCLILIAFMKHPLCLSLNFKTTKLKGQRPWGSKTLLRSSLVGKLGKIAFNAFRNYSTKLRLKIQNSRIQIQEYKVNLLNLYQEEQHCTEKDSNIQVQQFHYKHYCDSCFCTKCNQHYGM